MNLVLEQLPAQSLASGASAGLQLVLMCERWTPELCAFSRTQLFLARQPLFVFTNLAEIGCYLTLKQVLLLLLRFLYTAVLH